MTQTEDYTAQCVSTLESLRSARREASEGEVARLMQQYEARIKSDAENEEQLTAEETTTRKLEEAALYDRLLHEEAIIKVRAKNTAPSAGAPIAGITFLVLVSMLAGALLTHLLMSK